MDPFRQLLAKLPAAATLSYTHRVRSFCRPSGSSSLLCQGRRRGQYTLVAAVWPSRTFLRGYSAESCVSRGQTKPLVLVETSTLLCFSFRSFSTDHVSHSANEAGDVIYLCFCRCSTTAAVCWFYPDNPNQKSPTSSMQASDWVVGSRWPYFCCYTSVSINSSCFARRTRH